MKTENNNLSRSFNYERKTEIFNLVRWSKNYFSIILNYLKYPTYQGFNNSIKNSPQNYNTLSLIGGKSKTLKTVNSASINTIYFSADIFVRRIKNAGGNLFSLNINKTPIEGLVLPLNEKDKFIRAFENMHFSELGWKTFIFDDHLYIVSKKDYKLLENNGCLKRGNLRKQFSSSIQLKNKELEFQTKSTVILCPGTLGKISSKGMMCDTGFFLLKGLNVLAFDYPGSGLSKGYISKKEIDASLDTLHHFLNKKKEVANEQMLIHGHCFGSGPAASFAARHKGVHLSLKEAYWDSQQLAIEKINKNSHYLLRKVQAIYFKIFGFDYKLDEYLKEVKGSTFIAINDTDELINHEHDKRNIKALNNSDNNAFKITNFCAKHGGPLSDFCKKGQQKGSKKHTYYEDKAKEAIGISKDDKNWVLLQPVDRDKKRKPEKEFAEFLSKAGLTSGSLLNSLSKSNETIDHNQIEKVKGKEKDRDHSNELFLFCLSKQNIRKPYNQVKALIIEQYGKRLFEEVDQCYEFEGDLTPEQVRQLLVSCALKVKTEDLQLLHQELCEGNLTLRCGDRLTEQEKSELTSVKFNNLNDAQLHILINLYRSVPLNGKLKPITKVLYKNKVPKFSNNILFENHLTTLIYFEQIEKWQLSRKEENFDIWQKQASGEFMARYISYAFPKETSAKQDIHGIIFPTLNEKGEVSFRTVQESVHKKGLVAHFCVPLSKGQWFNKNNPSSSKFPIDVTFRGTYCQDSLKRDIFEGPEPGEQTYEQLNFKLQKCFSKCIKGHDKVDVKVYGHSLGFDDAFRFMANVTDVLANKPIEEKIPELYSSKNHTVFHKDFQNIQTMEFYGWNGPKLRRRTINKYNNNRIALLKRNHPIRLRHFINIVDEDAIQSFGKCYPGYARDKDRKAGLDPKTDTFIFNYKFEDKIASIGSTMDSHMSCCLATDRPVVKEIMDEEALIRNLGPHSQFFRFFGGVSKRIKRMPKNINYLVRLLAQTLIGKLGSKKIVNPDFKMKKLSKSIKQQQP